MSYKREVHIEEANIAIKESKEWAKNGQFNAAIGKLEQAIESYRLARDCERDNKALGKAFFVTCIETAIALVEKAQTQEDKRFFSGKFEAYRTVYLSQFEEDDYIKTATIRYSSI